ncbi:MAG: alpha-L-fucosidase [Bryobacteraceae bacterium]|nr:alpha-L-fucosidase [Bryobacteraceae bacterium]
MALSPMMGAFGQSGTAPGARSFGAPEAAIQRWREARFGMFIHWGLYSVLGHGEWAVFAEQIDYRDYAKLADQFNASEFDAAAMAAAAKSAGMKYMVLTSRHHDGFCLWDSKVSDFKSTNSAARRDLVAEYVRACRDAGLLVGLYYSPLDWRFPGFFFPAMYRESAEAMKRQTYEQVEELLTNYGKIDILWFDGGGDDWLGFGGLEWGYSAGWRTRDLKWPQEKHYAGKPLWETEKLYELVRRLQPEVLMNGRAASHGDWQGDFGTPERKVGEFDPNNAWETCEVLCTSWGWEPNDPMKSLRTCVQLLARTAVNDGNLLLNVGPTGPGAIEPRQAERLKEIGAWLEQHGQSIYGTRGGPFRSGAWGGSTHRGSSIYLHIVDWPENAIELPPLKRKIVASRGMTGAKPRIEQTPQGIRVSVPPERRQEMDTVIVLELDAPV